jgi:type IV secretory pathway TrbD component
MAEADRLLVYRARGKFLLLGSFLIMFGLLGVVAGEDGKEWWVVIAGVGFAFLGAFMLRQAARRDPALVIDAGGIESRIQGFRLGWDEVEEIRPQSRYAGRFVRQRMLLLRVQDIDRVVRQAPNRFARAVGALDRKLGVRTAFIPLSMLSMSPRDVLNAVRSFYRGPIRGEF